MKRLYQLSLFIVIIISPLFLIFGCDNDENYSISDKTCYLSKIYLNGKLLNEFFYDTNHNLDSVINNYYNSEDLLEYCENRKYHYSVDNKLFKIVYYNSREDKWIFYDSLLYNNISQIHKLIRIEEISGILDTTSCKLITYNSDNLISKISSFNQEDICTGTSEFTYDTAGNYINQSGLRWNTVLYDPYDIYYEYDIKKNPFYTIKYSPQCIYPIPKNNINRKYWYNEFVLMMDDHYTYNYNLSGYPVTKIDGDRVYTYEYYEFYEKLN
ncbi:MAG: hypothetical protein ACQERU_08380 [Bacteroidota bacterium]